jgi:deoxycytidylate deaminase
MARVVPHKQNIGETLMSVCEVLARQSTCAFQKSSAIAIKAGRIACHGLKGTVPPAPTCYEHHFKQHQEEWNSYHEVKSKNLVGQKKRSKSFSRSHLYTSKSIDLGFKEYIKDAEHDELNEVHAYEDLICGATKLGISLDKAFVMSSHPPCLRCAKLLHHCGVVKVYYKKEGDAGLAYLRSVEISCNNYSLYNGTQ